MKTIFEEVMELWQVAAADERTALAAPAAPVAASDCEYDGERWDGLS